MWGGLPVLQRGGWVAGPYEFGFSVMLKDVVLLFFLAERRGGGACPGGIAFACGYWRRDRGSGLSGCLFP